MQVLKLKREFLTFPRQVGWDRDAGGGVNSGSDGGDQSRGHHRGFKSPTGAAQGNFLEAINVTLNVLEKHYMDRDLSRTGNSIVMISPSSGVFRVEDKLAQITQVLINFTVPKRLPSRPSPPSFTATIIVTVAINATAARYHRHHHLASHH